MTQTNIITLPPLNEPESWDDIIPFNEVETPEIKASLLPEPFYSFANALACETETSESLSVMTILGVLSTACTKHFTINPRDGWSEPVNIYTMIALPPANNKSLVLKRCTAPLITWEDEQIAQLEPEIKQHQSDRKTQEKIIETLRKKAASEKDYSKQREIIDQIKNKEASLIETRALPQLFANDTTPESLITSTLEQGGRFAIISDEGGIMDVLAGLYTNGNTNIDIILKGIDGGEVRVRRKDRSFNLKPYLTMLLVVQPAIIQSLAEKRSYAGNGALERFLYVLPNSQLGYRKHNNPCVPQNVKAAYHARITEMLNLQPLKTGPYQLQLSEDAYTQWRNFQKGIEIDLRPDGKLSNCQGWGGKICGFVLRIAGLLHIGEHLNHELIIQENTMVKAICIGGHLVEHAIAAYSLMGCDQTTEDAKTILRWVIKNKFKMFTRTQLINAMKNRKSGKLDRLNKAIAILINHNILSDEAVLPTVKPTKVHYVNPECFSDQNQEMNHNSG